MARIASALAACALTACAANPAKETALLVVDEIDNYQASVAAKIEAEQMFYKDIRETLKAAAERQSWVDRRVATRNRITELTDRAIVRDKGLEVSVLQQFLRDENVFARSEKQAELERKKEIQNNYEVQFAALVVKQQELGTTRSKLLTLTQDSEASKVLYERIREAAAMAKQLEEKEATDAGTGEN
jgi:hypothetical protein